MLNLISEDIFNYCVNHSTRPSPLAKELEIETKNNVHGSQMLIGELEASVIIFLLKLSRAKRILEFGTFTGYSALIMAETLPTDGEIITIDINKETTNLAKKFWEKSPARDKIKLILKPGLEAVKEVSGKFDFIFIDADKFNYSNYLEWSLQHLNPNGMILTDNTLWSGKVILDQQDKQTEAIKAHNRLAASLSGYTKTLLPIRDGMFLITAN